jgi:hypothetical protein
MTDQKTQTTNKTPLVIPDEVKTMYPDLVPQILQSASMDNDERNYWFGVLPIMTPDQVTELRDILKTEQERMAKKRAQEKKQVPTDPVQLEAERRMAQKKRRQEEEKHREMDHENAEDLLEELEGL